jgi:hypothetical protein
MPHSRLLGSIAALVVVLVAAAPALGQKPAARARNATTHAEKGQRYYDIQRWDDAIREFEAAYEVGGDPSYLYNLAQAHRKAGHTGEAIRYYELYLSRVPTAPNRASIEQLVAELKASQPAAPPAPAAPPVYAPPAAPGPSPPSPPGPPAAAPPPTPGAVVPDPVSPPPGAMYPPASVGPPQPGGVQASTPLPVANKHDGVFIRLQVGGGAMAVVSSDSDDQSFSGAGPRLALAMGWAANEKVVIYGEVFHSFVTNATFSEGGDEVETDVDISTTGFGAGAALYLASNFYLSGTAGVGRLKFQSPLLGSVKTDWGPGFHLAAGKEWWVGRNLAVGGGLLLEVFVAKPSDNDSVSLTEAWLGFGFNGTFN